MKFTLPDRQPKLFDLPAPEPPKTVPAPVSRPAYIKPEVNPDPASQAPQVGKLPDGKPDPHWLVQAIHESLRIMPQGRTHFIGEISPGVAVLIVTGYPFAYILATGVEGDKGNLKQAHVAQRVWSKEDQRHGWEIPTSLPEIVQEFLEHVWNYINIRS